MIPILIALSGPAAAAGLCGDGTCQALIESCRDCPADCGACKTDPAASCAGTAMCGQGTASCFCDYLCFQKQDCCLDVCLWCPNLCANILPTCGDGLCSAGEDCTGCPADCACPVCGDGACDLAIGESCGTCSADCGNCCGDSYCDGDVGEDCAFCPTDCGPCNACGNGVCEKGLGETSITCPIDCPVECGDGACHLQYESCSTCPSDCGVCQGVPITPAALGPPTMLCAGLCGNNRDDCWCDAFCHIWGDCCSDVCTHCPMMPGCTSVCGDGHCAVDEDCDSCPGDCTFCPKCGDGLCQKLYEGCKECPADCGSCCGNGVCEADLGETHATCPKDCPSSCGDLTCASGESCGSCPEDCGSCCGNGTCEPGKGEDCTTCLLDCPPCAGQAVCGDLTCQADKGENCVTCPTDCPLCLCTQDADASTIPDPKLYLANLYGVKLGWEKTWTFPPGACDMDEVKDPLAIIDGGLGQSIPVGIFLKYKPAETTTKKSFEKASLQCKGESEVATSAGAGICFLGRTLAYEFSASVSGKCAYDATCSPQAVPTYQCVNESYCCEHTTAVASKVALELPVNIGKAGKEKVFFGKIALKCGVSVAADLSFIDDSVTYKGPTCGCLDGKDVPSFKVQLQMAGKGSCGVKWKGGPEWVNGSGTISLTGCVSGGVTANGCSDSTVIVGRSLEVKAELNLFGLITVPPLAHKLVEPGSVGCN